MLWSFNTFQVVKCCWHNDLIIVNIQTGFVLVYFSGRWLAFSLGWLQYSFLSLTKTLAWQALVAWWCDMVSRSVDVDSISSLAIYQILPSLMMNNNACFVLHVSCHDLLPLLMLAFQLFILPLWCRNGSCLSPCSQTNIGHESNWVDAGPVFRWMISEASSACFDENPNSVPFLVLANW